MSLEAIVFRNRRGQQLVGVLHHGKGEGPRPCLVVCHGFAGTKVGGSRRFVEFARYAAERNVSVFRFDFAGSGDSEGDLTGLTLDHELEDLQAAVQAVAELNDVDPHRIGVVGHCMGAVTALRGAAKDPAIYRTVAWAPFIELEDAVSKLVGEEAYELLRDGDEADFIYNEQLFSCGPLLLQQPSDYDLRNAVDQIERPVLIIHGSEDALVSAHAVESLLQPIVAGRADKRLLILEGAHHSFPYHKDELFEHTVNWFVNDIAEPTKEEEEIVWGSK